MIVYFSIFAALAICVGWAVARIYEWRQDVLYGPYFGRDRSLQATCSFAHAEMRTHKVAVSPNQTAPNRCAKTIEEELEIDGQ
jgi:hypothetical protein